MKNSKMSPEESRKEQLKLHALIQRKNRAVSKEAKQMLKHPLSLQQIDEQILRNTPKNHPQRPFLEFQVGKKDYWSALQKWKVLKKNPSGTTRKK